MKAYERLQARARLYGPAPRELAASVLEGVQHATHAASELRIEEPGALDRLDRLADQLDGVRRYISTIRERIAPRGDAA